MLGRCLCLLGLGALMVGLTIAEGGEKKGEGITVDKDKKTISIPCKVAPRKVLKDKIYPIEVVACWAHPKGQKAHETVVVFDIKPSLVHKALESFGLKAGKPALGENGKAAGPEVVIFLEIPGEDGKATRIPIEETMVDTKSNAAFPKQKWLFTGSAIKYPDPEKDDKAYGADLSGTLITIYPVTDDTVFQSALGAKDEGKFRLETNKKVLPKEGTAVKLVLEVK